MTQKKFKPPTKGRFIPPVEVIGRTSATFVTGGEVRSANPTPVIRCIGSAQTRFGGEESLMTDGKRYWIKLRGLPSNAARMLADAEDRYHFLESVFIESELVPDWCKAHGISR